MSNRTGWLVDLISYNCVQIISIYDFEQVCFYCLKLSLQRFYLCLSFPPVVGVDCESWRSPHPNRGISNMTLNCIQWWDFSSEDLDVIFWPSTRPKMPFKVMHRKELTHSDGSYERKSHGRKLADEMGRAKKSHDTLID